jgi:hypothetical protein
VEEAEQLRECALGAVVAKAFEADAVGTQDQYRLPHPNVLSTMRFTFERARGKREVDGVTFVRGVTSPLTPSRRAILPYQPILEYLMS